MEKPTTVGKSEDSKKHKSGDRRRSLDEHKKKAKSQDQRIARPPSRKYNNFTDVIKSFEDVFLAIRHTGVYKRPDSMRGHHSKRN